MPVPRHSGASFAARLAEWSSLACRTQPDALSRHAIAAAAAALEAEFDAVVEALGERQVLLERLAKIQQSITRRAQLQPTLQAIVDGAAELLDEPIAGLRLIDPDDPRMLDVVAQVGLTDEQYRAMRRTPSGQGAGGRAVTEERLVVVEDYQEAGNMIDAIRQRGAHAAIAAPVREGGQVVGSLVVASTRAGRRFNEY